MYLPAAFEESRPEALCALIADHPLGALVTVGPHGLDANHLPFEFDPAAGAHGTLRAHVARANPVWREAAERPEALVIFQGPSAYISPSWYPSKLETHRHVPTYNYMVVHAHGRIAVRDDEKFLRGLLARLTRRMEASQPEPWKMGEAPADYLSQLLADIVGIEIELTRLVGKSKLGQNREPRDRRGAAVALTGSGGDTASVALGKAMLDVPPALD